MLNVIVTFISIVDETITLGGGVYTIMADLLGAFFVVELLRVKRIGFYGMVAMAIIDSLFILFLSDGDAVALLTRKILGMAVLFGCLCLKKDGMSGWKALFGSAESQPS